MTPLKYLWLDNGVSSWVLQRLLQGMGDIIAPTHQIEFLKTMTPSICVAQINCVVGDMAGNARKIVEWARQAHARGVRLVLTPELAICGYAAEDWLLRPSFIAACDAALESIAHELADLTDLALVLGHPGTTGRHASTMPTPKCYNRSSVLCGGRVLAVYDKRELPNYRVFDENRYFQTGQQPTVFSHAGVKYGLLICEDAWYPQPATDCLALGAEVLLVQNASPFHLGKGSQRESALAARCRETGLPLVYAHLVGGQDELVFEGRSFALDALGQVSARAVGFREQALDLHLKEGAWCGPIHSVPEPESDLWQALVLGVRDYIGKNNFPGVLLGLSGGVDSALVLAIAVDALGADRVQAVMLPSPYTADISWQDACEMSRRLGVRYDEISIVPVFEAFLASLQPVFKESKPDTTEENLQARIRGTLLMAVSNKFGRLVLTTGNKSELATGYCTLYGDMAGGFAVIKDLTKTWVFRLARWRNLNDPFGTGIAPIPERIIERPPSAELRPGQTDQDSLPPYEVLDQILVRYIEEDQSVAAIIDAGFDRDTVLQVAQMLHNNEFKRRQAPVGVRVTRRSFGKDWRYPLTHRFCL